MSDPTQPVVRLIAIDDPEGIAGVEAQRMAEDLMLADTRTEYVVQLGYASENKGIEWEDSRYSPHDTKAAAAQHLQWMATHHGTDAVAFRLVVRVVAETVLEEIRTDRFGFPSGTRWVAVVAVDKSGATLGRARAEVGDGTTAQANSNALGALIAKFGNAIASTSVESGK